MINLNALKRKKERDLEGLIKTKNAANEALLIETTAAEKQEKEQSEAITAELQKLEAMALADPAAAKKFLETKVSRGVEQVLEDKINKALPNKNSQGANLLLMKGNLSKVKQHLCSDEGAQIYAKRKIEVESAFGQIEGNRSFCRFSLRGLEKVNIEFGLVATAHNFLKQVKKILVLR